MEAINTITKVRWELKETSDDSRIKELLKEGWEPFAATPRADFETDHNLNYWPRILFRRKVEKNHS